MTLTEAFDVSDWSGNSSDLEIEGKLLPTPPISSDSFEESPLNSTTTIENNADNTFQTQVDRSEHCGLCGGDCNSHLKRSSMTGSRIIDFATNLLSGSKSEKNIIKEETFKTKNGYEAVDIPVFGYTKRGKVELKYNREKKREEWHLVQDEDSRDRHGQPYDEITTDTHLGTAFHTFKATRMKGDQSTKYDTVTVDCQPFMRCDERNEKHINFMTNLWRIASKNAPKVIRDVKAAGYLHEHCPKCKGSLNAYVKYKETAIGSYFSAHNDNAAITELEQAGKPPFICYRDNSKISYSECRQYLCDVEQRCRNCKTKFEGGTTMILGCQCRYYEKNLKI